MLKLILALLVISNLGCSFAPVNSPKSAQAIPEGELNFDAGLSPDLYAHLYKGFGNNFELGGMIAYQGFPILSVTAKYSVLNNEEGISLGAFLGLFYAIDPTSSQGYYVAPIMSYKKNWFETYMSARYNWVKWKLSELDSDNIGDSLDFLLDLDDSRFAYMQYELGFNFWVKEKVAINLSAKYFHFFEVEDETEGFFIPGISLILKN